MNRNPIDEAENLNNLPVRQPGRSQEPRPRGGETFARNPFPTNYDFRDGKRTVLRLNPVRVS